MVIFVKLNLSVSILSLFVTLILMNNLGDFVFLSQVLIICDVCANKQTVAREQSQYYPLVPQMFKINFCLKDMVSQITNRQRRSETAICLLLDKCDMERE